MQQKTEPDSKNNDKGEIVKEEEIIAVTTRELCDYFKEVKKKPIINRQSKTYISQSVD